MKVSIKVMAGLKANKYALFILATSILIFSSSIDASGATLTLKQDISVAAAIKTQLTNYKHQLYYPRSVERFYKQSGFKLAWIAPDTIKTHASDAMMLLDCVIQYGLNHADYHPHELLYDQLSLLTTQKTSTSNLQKALFDIWLTDAMITFENNLHYGRFNPDYPTIKIDAKNWNGFNAAGQLLAALQSKDFVKMITQTQPQSKAYHSLKYHMYLLTGLYTGDCYEFPESDIRRMAINLERLRWYNSRKKAPIEINIPSLTLTFHLRDSDYRLKVKMNKTTLHSLATQSAARFIARISVTRRQVALYLTPLVIIQTLHEVPAKVLAKDAPCIIRVINGKNLANLLLKVNNDKVGLALNKAATVSITYLTCEVREGTLITYKDVYHKDKNLEMILYSKNRTVYSWNY
jgi:murein L,D-transpeptidase YcbB/YkuD